MANSGIVYGDVRVGTQPETRSGYGEQVLRIAPEILAGREAEIQELAAFCTGGAVSPYTWWRAGAWAGKTALMSWFALHPPEGVRVVPFFVTARFAAQNDRVAFTDVVLEQLGELLGEGPVAFLTPSTREAHLLRLLEEAAHRCRQRGERLVLLVDGLDEDRGVTTGPDAYSIAALLPARPPAGMRVIVAGRPDPPVPGDVPENHPLHDPGIVRLLEASPFAQVIRVEAQRELKHLLAGPGAERELLGLLTASGGGLGTAHLAELTDRSPYEVEETLRSRAGRTFRMRESPSRPGELSPVFVLGHEELLDHAVRMLGPKELGAYRDRIHAWADLYADARWPSDTPEYLLRGYFSLLRATADVPRLAVLVADSARHDRMRDLTGGDSAALTEIRSTQHSLLEADAPDLTALLRLAVRRDSLHARNEYVPVGLPAVWVTLGQPRRAEALARSLAEPRRRAEALTAVGQALADAGTREEAEAVFVDAAENARADLDPLQRVLTLVEVGRAWWPVEPKGAGALLREATDRAAALTVSSPRPQALVAVAEGWMEAGERDQTRAALSEAVALARSGFLREKWQRAGVLAGAGRVLHALGETERAEETWVEAEALLPESSDPLVSVAWALRDRPEQRERVGELLARAEAVARSGEEGEEGKGDWALLQIGIVLSAAGFAERAEEIARGITEKAQLLAFVSTDLAERGEQVRAETLARSFDEPLYRARALASVAKALVTEGRHAEAESLAEEIEALAPDAVDPISRAWELIDLGAALATTGQQERALALLDAAEAVVRAHVGSPEGERVGRWLGSALIGAGAQEQAEALARSLTDPLWRVRLLTEVGRAVATGADRPRAVQILEEAEIAAGLIGDPVYRGHELADVAVALVTASADERAETLARSVEYPGTDGNQALDHVGKELGIQGRHIQGAAVLARCETEARGMPEIGDRVWRLAFIAEGFASCGHPERAAQLLTEAESEARQIPDPEGRAQHLTAVGEALTICGDYERARLLFGETAEIVRALPGTPRRDQSLGRVGAGLVATGAYLEAEELVVDIGEPRYQARVLTALAEVVAPEQARRLVARCLCAAPWQHALDGLAVAAPSALVTIADEEYGGGERITTEHRDEGQGNGRNAVSEKIPGEGRAT
ncbi:hypothetical protein [Streptacidiphilus sp. PAMC 29251]